MATILFQRQNHHQMETPLAFGIHQLTTTPNYVGYFENEHREQFLFVYDYEQQQGRVWAGDFGADATTWTIRDLEEDRPDLLNQSEDAWLTCCWMTARRLLPQRFA